MVRARIRAGTCEARIPPAKRVAPAAGELAWRTLAPGPLGPHPPACPTTQPTAHMSKPCANNAHLCTQSIYTVDTQMHGAPVPRRSLTQTTAMQDPKAPPRAHIHQATSCHVISRISLTQCNDTDCETDAVRPGGAGPLEWALGSGHSFERSCPVQHAPEAGSVDGTSC